jgi:precorrin-6B C5,15-methyltransferase / cobalt-precorrin-6B C5,C15-methyltransferase
MSAPIYIIGMGADGPAGLRPEQIERILNADFLAGGERHLAHFPQARGERFVLKDNLPSLLEELGRRWPEASCVVLASGDPLFYGVGTHLAGILGRENVSIEPALSSMQLAFARVRLPWQYAALASVHGRRLRPILLPLLGHRLIGLFTHDGDSPAAIARFFLDHGVDFYQAIVGENLGTADERISRWGNLHELAGQRFGPLNYLILQRGVCPVPLAEVERNRALVPGVPDEVFARPESGPEVMTRQEVRAVVLTKLLGPTSPGETVWDVGAGLGTVSAEIAVLRPDVEVVAVERDPERASFLRTNREHFGAYNVRVLEGAAPDVLHAETERPRLIFLGGSGGRLAELLPFLTERLQGGGRLVATFVTLEHLGLALQHFRALGWPLEVTEVHVARSDPLAGLTGLRPQRGVFILRADQPEKGEGVRA